MFAVMATLAVVGFAGLAPGRERLASFQERDALPKGSVAGRVTGLPVPRFVSLKAPKAYLRSGPGDKWAVRWEYRHRDLPLMVIDEYDHWRKVRDADGTEGWLHKNLLVSARTVTVTAPSLTVRRAPDLKAAPAAVLEHRVVTRLQGCSGDWCRVRDVNFEGWVPRNAVWGVAAYEGQI